MRDKPHARLTRVTPPQPKAFASLAAISRRLRSSKCGQRSRNFSDNSVTVIILLKHNLDQGPIQVANLVPLFISGALGVGTGLRLDADVVVHSSANTLLASEVSFRRLDRNVSEQKLDLFQFSARGMTELRAGAPQIMWRHLQQTDCFRILLYHVPNHSLRNAITPSFACPTNASEQPPSRNAS